MEEAIETSVCVVAAVPDVGSSFATSVRGSVEGFNFSELHVIGVGSKTSPTIYVCHSLSYLISNMPNETLGDAMQAQMISLIWHLAFYLQVVALMELGRENDPQIN
ncbi:unnamed protein product [Vicia faba]|uniref:Serine/threonine-protein kinase BSK1-like TPR repeats domain-containing protein n=1 Tax=Vicia faba TaxID=3906 RepID=A0AAV1A353_VICFA|nr:unnamed protein product [Vicia faba]